MLGDMSVSMTKKLSDTLCSCHANAVGALIKGYDELMHMLISISEDSDETADCHCKPCGLHDQMSKLETRIFAEFWNDVLQHFNQSSKMLQSGQFNLNAAVVLKSTVYLV